MRFMKTRLVAATLAATLTLGSTGCTNALGLQDWQRDIAAALVGGIGAFLVGQTTQITVERECFENGEPIECAALP